MRLIDSEELGLFSLLGRIAEKPCISVPTSRWLSCALPFLQCTHLEPMMRKEIALVRDLHAISLYFD